MSAGAPGVSVPDQLYAPRGEEMQDDSATEPPVQRPWRLLRLALAAGCALGLLAAVLWALAA